MKDKVESKNEDLVKADNDVMEAKFKVVEQEGISKKIIAELKEESRFTIVHILWLELCR